jgi:hypothetical protein
MLASNGALKQHFGALLAGFSREAPEIGVQLV